MLRGSTRPPEVIHAEALFCARKANTARAHQIEAEWHNLEQLEREAAMADKLGIERR